MCPFLFAAVVDTVVAPYYEDAYLHEWGVVMYSESTISVTGRPDESLLAPLPVGPITVDAPVIYLYGGEFDFSLTVTVPGGTITEAWPLPDGSLDTDLPFSDQRDRDVSSITWSGLTTCCPYTSDTSPSPGDEACAEPSIVGFYGDIWRDVESLVLTRPSDGFRDQFLFYECRLEAGALPPPLARPGDVLTDVSTYDGAVLVVSRMANSPDVGIYVADSRDAWVIPPSSSRIRVLTPDQAFDVFSGWARGDTLSGNGLKEPEIEAMWKTWAPFFTGGDWHGTNLMVFPMPQRAIDRISTVVLDTMEGYPVTYNRFFLGVVTNR